MLNKFISKFNFAFTYPCPRKLREIAHLSLFERENRERIGSIWQEYHSDKPESISYAISKNEFKLLEKQ